MKVTLIQPPKLKSKVAASDHWELTRPFSLFYLASYAKLKTDCEINILDLESKKYKGISTKTVLQDNDSSIFGITATTYTRFEAIEISQLIKSINPNAIVVVGGPHFMYCAEDTLQHVDSIDFVIRGEGEIPFSNFLYEVNGNQNFEKIKGLSYRQNGIIEHNPDEIIFEDLDSIPFYSDFDWDTYPEFLFGVQEKIPATSIMTSRGCPYQCVFCSKAGMKYRLRKPEFVVDEIQLLMEKFKINAFNFLDLTFTASPNHARKVCEEIINRKLDIKWWCESRVNIPLNVLEIMKEAGCVSLVIGVESGSNRIINDISKNISLELVEKFCQKCNELSIRIQPYFMYSHPGEEESDVYETLKFIDKLENYTEKCSFQPTMIFPGTEIEAISRKKNIIPKDFSWSDPYFSQLNIELDQLTNIPLFIDNLTPEFMKKIYKERILSRNFDENSDLSFFELIKKGIRAILSGKSSAKLIFSIELYKKIFQKIIRDIK